MSYINGVFNGEAHPSSSISFFEGGVLQRFTGAALVAHGRRLARALELQGIRAGDRVGILSRNRHEWVLLDLACIALGAVAASLDSKMDLLEPGVLASLDLACLFTDDERYMALAIYRPIGAVAQLIEQCQEPLAHPVRHGPRQAVCLKFTSGSTGRPKGLLAAAESIDSSLEQVEKLFHHDTRDHILVFMPLSLLQQRYWVYSSLRLGHATTITPYESVFPAMAAVCPTVLMGVPGFFHELESLVRMRARRLAAGAPVEGQHLRSAMDAVSGGAVRYLWTGSAPCPVRLIEFFGQLGTPLYNGYGLNETCIISKNAPGADRLGSVGKVLSSKTVSFDARGQILVRSEAPIACRYEITSAPGDNDLFIGEDVVATGDTGHMDEDGYLYITGRIKDLLVMQNGQSIQPGDVERPLLTHEGVDFALVCGDDRPHLSALIWPKSADVDIDAVVAEVNHTLPQHMRLLRYQVMHDLDRSDRQLFTSQMKPIRPTFHERFAQPIELMYTRRPV